MGTSAEHSNFSGPGFWMGIAGTVVLAAITVCLLSLAYAFFGVAVWPGDGGSGEAIADPPGFMIMGGVCLFLATPLIVGTWFAIRFHFGRRQISNRLLLWSGAAAALMFSALMIALGVSAAFTPVDSYYADWSWVSPVVALLYTLPGLAGLRVTWRLVRPRRS